MKFRLNRKSDNPGGESSSEAKERLLDSASKLFSQKGFEGTTVREIIKDAGCNIAAVNYHFGGKEKLYYEVIRRHMIILRERRIKAIKEIMEKGDYTIEELLRGFANAFIEPLISDSSGRRFMMLLAREMMDSRVSHEVLFKETIKPVMDVMQEAIEKIYPKVSMRDSVACVHSLVGQLLHAVHTHKWLNVLKDEFEAYSFNEVVEHIVRFSSAGIRYYASGEK